jgi:SAM-dependent methyltransferase
MNKPSSFDEYAVDYDAALAQGIKVSGEDKAYFAQGRVAWLARRLETLQARPESVLDFGCGTGSATPYFYKLLPVTASLGLDTSAKSIEVARQQHGSDRARFDTRAAYKPDGSMDLAFCNGVFHHIPLAERAGAATIIYQSLRPGGWLAFWENNPWNPGTRLVMRRIPFDRDAIPLTPPAAAKLLRAIGFEVVRTDFLFIFPRLLGWFRPLERPLCRLPLGAQYQLLCRKPHHDR